MCHEDDNSLYYGCSLQRLENCIPSSAIEMRSYWCSTNVQAATSPKGDEILIPCTSVLPPGDPFSVSQNTYL